MKLISILLLCSFVLVSCGKGDVVEKGEQVIVKDNKVIDKKEEIKKEKKTEILVEELKPVVNFSGSIDDVEYSDNLEIGTGSSNIGGEDIIYTKKSNFSNGTGSTNAEAEKSGKKSINSKMMLILDVSGSMAGQIGGKAKIETAREVVKKVTKDYEKNTQIGFMAYGQNRKGDCNDIETLVQPAKETANKISSIVDTLTPKGMTPMGSSVLKAAQEMKYSEEKTSIVLVTDGKETCDVDICELGKKLEKDGIDFTAHVISFGVDKKDTANMQCLAESTGGKFLMANDADSLGKALDDAVSSSACGDNSNLKLTLHFPEEVIAGANTKIKWDIEGGERFDKIAFYKGGEEPKFFEYIYPGSTKKKKGEQYIHTAIKVPEIPGEYKLVYVNNCKDILLEKDVIVKKSSVEIYAPDIMVAGSHQKIKWNRNSNARFDKITFYKGGEEPKTLEYIYPSSTKLQKGETKYRARIDVPEEAGEYELIYQTYKEKKVLFSKKITVIKPKIALYTPDVMVAGSQQRIKWNRNSNARFDKITFYKGGEEPKTFEYIYPSSTKLQKGEKRYKENIGVPEEAGEYELIYQSYKDKNILLSKKIKVITPTVKITAPQKIKAGEKIDISWKRDSNARFDQIAFYKGGEEPKVLNYIYPSSTKLKKGETVFKAKIKAPSEAGEYEIIYLTYKNKNILFKKKITVY